MVNHVVQSPGKDKDINGGNNNVHSTPINSVQQESTSSSTTDGAASSSTQQQLVTVSVGGGGGNMATTMAVPLQPVQTGNGTIYLMMSPSGLATPINTNYSNTKLNSANQQLFQPSQIQLVQNNLNGVSNMLSAANGSTFIPLSQFTSQMASAGGTSDQPLITTTTFTTSNIVDANGNEPKQWSPSEGRQKGQNRMTGGSNGNDESADLSLDNEQEETDQLTYHREQDKHNRRVSHKISWFPLSNLSVLVEKRRRDRIRFGIDRLFELLPDKYKNELSGKQFMKGADSKGVILEKVIDYVTDLRHTPSNQQQAQIITHLQRRNRTLEADNDRLRRHISSIEAIPLPQDIAPCRIPDVDNIDSVNHIQRSNHEQSLNNKETLIRLKSVHRNQSITNDNERSMDHTMEDSIDSEVLVTQDRVPPPLKRGRT